MARVAWLLVVGLATVAHALSLGVPGIVARGGPRMAMLPLPSMRVSAGAGARAASSVEARQCTALDGDAHDIRNRNSLAGVWARAFAASLLCCALAGPPSSHCAVAAELTAAESAATTAAVSQGGSPIASEVLTLLDKYYLDRTFNGFDLKAARAQLNSRGPLTEDEALEASTKWVKQLGDRYSRVLSPTQATKLGKYDVTGVGINLIISDDGAVKVGAVPPSDSDAAQLGVQFGDVVLSINGRSSAGMTSFDALEAIQGDGASVTMRIKPVGGAAERDVVLRKVFQTKNPVTYKLVPSDSDDTSTGYIKLSEFNAQCKRRVKEAVDQLTADGATRLVLDLRGNGGGVLDGALGIAGLFLERPLVLYVTDANGSMQPLYSREPLVSEDTPLQVWVDQGTASSGEVLAAALRDNCRAKLVGGVTYGKGIIQGVFGLSDGGALIETVASYSTPSREEINRKGVTPDEKKTFVSDVLGAGFVDADVKAATIAPRIRNGVCPTNTGAPKQPTGSSLLSAQ